MAKDFQQLVSEFLEKDPESAWKAFNKFKDKLRVGFIKDLEGSFPEKNSRQAWNKTSGNILEFFTVAYINKYLGLQDVRADRDVDVPSVVKYLLKINFMDETLLPDMDIVVYSKKLEKPEVKCIISCKTSLRERVSQTPFWKLAMRSKSLNVPFLFVTSDPDNELYPGRKWRPVMEDVMDGVFIVKGGYPFSDNIRPFPEIINKIKSL